jgi:hypothetical protein
MQPFLLSRTYIFAAFGGHWPGAAFLILALSGNLALGAYSARYNLALFRTVGKLQSRDATAHYGRRDHPLKTTNAAGGSHDLSR